MSLIRSVSLSLAAGANHASTASSLSQDTPTVFVVDNDASAREALELLIRTQGWQSLTFGSAAEFLDCPPVAVPCCLLLDVILPDLSGLDLQQRVADRRHMPVIFITGETDVQVTVRAMKAGALEYLAKPPRSNVLLSVISFALERSHALLRHEAESCRLRNCHASLTRRELEVMELVVGGRLNKQIAAALRLSEITVKVHRAKMMRKMQARSLAELVNMAVRLGQEEQRQG